ncbi:MAG: hypothetical protein JSV68_01905 [Anaerolineaceae bacterium]|nr:MAG: hypothetical protein JSV68_01905 [Anaerolineaceae bacterium]
MALTLPPTLTFLNATPPATVASNVLYWDITQWPAHSAPQTILVSVTPGNGALGDLTIKAAIDSVTPEVNLRNNQSTATVSVAQDHFLPLVGQP